MAAGQPRTSFRPRSAYIDHSVYGSGDGALLIEPDVVNELAAAAARAGNRPVGGLLYGCAWHDDEGEYTVVDAFIQADTAADLGLPETISELRADAAQHYPQAVEVGWWRSAPRPGNGAQADQDPGTWPMDQRPDGIGLVVHADGTPWEASGPPDDGWGRPAPGARRPATPEALAHQAPAHQALSQQAPAHQAPEPGAPAQQAPAPLPPARQAPPGEQEAAAPAAGLDPEPEPQQLLVSPMRTMGPPVLSPDPEQMWRPKVRYRRRQETGHPWWKEWWRDPQRVVAVLIITIGIIATIVVLVVLSPIL